MTVNVDAFMQTMELAAGAQTAMRLPFNKTEGTRVGDNKYKKEVLRVGEVVVDRATGRKFNFSSDFLKQLKNNFDNSPLDYVPLLYAKEGYVHASDSTPNSYGGMMESLELDDDENPTKAYGTFNLTDDTLKVIEHNPKFGVSITAHPNFVNKWDSKYYGPMLLDVNATHMPTLQKMGEWEKVTANLSDSKDEYEVIDLSDAEFNVVETTSKEKEGDTDMPENNETTQEQQVNLSDAQVQALLGTDAVKEAIRLSVQEATSAKDEEIANLRGSVDNIRKSSYETAVRTGLGSYVNQGVPPVMVELGQELLLSMEEDDAGQTIELSTGEGDDAKTEKLSRVQIVSRMLEEAKNVIDLSAEQGSGDEDNLTNELSDESRSAAVQQLLALSGQSLPNNNDSE